MDEYGSGCQRELCRSGHARRDGRTAAPACQSPRPGARKESRRCCKHGARRRVRKQDRSATRSLMHRDDPDCSRICLGLEFRGVACEDVLTDFHKSTFKSASSRRGKADADNGDWQLESGVLHHDVGKLAAHILGAFSDLDADAPGDRPVDFASARAGRADDGRFAGVGQLADGEFQW